MVLPRFVHRLAGWTAVWSVALVAVGCGSDGEGGITDPNGNGAAPSIQLSLSAQGGSVDVGDQLSFTATVTRGGGFQGQVQLAVEGAPSGVTSQVTDLQTQGATTTATVTLVAGTSASAGEHALTVRATASGVSPATAAFTLTVSEVDENGTRPAAEVTLDFNACPFVEGPIWVAFQDGAGAWQRLQGSGGLYTFDLTADVGGYAWAADDGGGTNVQAHLLTRQELTTHTLQMCFQPGGDNRVTGTVAGVDDLDQVSLSLGGGWGVAIGMAPDFEIVDVRDGTHDLVAYRANQMEPGPTSDRALIRRQVEVEDGASVGTLDFEGEEAFDPQFATLTVEGSQGHEVRHLMGYLTGPACVGSNASLYTDPGQTGTSLTMRGIPAAHQEAGDVHQVTATAVSGDHSRLVTEFFRVLEDRTVTLGPPIEPELSDEDGAYRRLAGTVQVPAFYRTGTDGAAQLSQISSGRVFTVAISLARATSAQVALTIPDFSGVDGWDNGWASAPGEQVDWTVGVSTSTLGADPQDFCQEGLWVALASRAGTR